MGALLSPSTLRYSRGVNPRRNLPTASKRGESNFLRAFERAYLGSLSQGLARAEFDLSGYGIADLVWVSWQSNRRPDETTAVGFAERPKVQIVAFELKLQDWRRALRQAFRYSYFANLAMVVVPPAVARRAQLAHFRQLGVGLWTFDAETGRIRRCFTPRKRQPRSAVAQQKALASLLALAKLR